MEKDRGHISVENAIQVPAHYMTPSPQHDCSPLYVTPVHPLPSPPPPGDRHFHVFLVHVLCWFVLPICFTHGVALLAHFQSSTCVCSVIFSLQRPFASPIPLDPQQHLCWMKHIGTASTQKSLHTCSLCLHLWRVPQFALKYPCNPPPPPGSRHLATVSPPPTWETVTR